MILVTSDLQISEHERDAYRLDFMRTTLPKMVRRFHAKELFILGDLTEAKDRHPAWLVNFMAERIAALSKEVDITILRGNHDGLTPDQPFFRFLRRLDFVTWINKPAVKSGFLFLPHTTNYKRDWKDFDMTRMVFTHNIFEGTLAANGHKLSGIPTKIFPKGTKVISGDVHEPQDIGPITYVGSPYLCDFGDDFNPRVLVINPKTMETSSYPVPGRQKRLVELTFPYDGGIRCKANAGDILKVRVHIETKDCAKWSEIKDGIRKWGEANKYEINIVQPIVSYVEGAKRTASAAQPKTDEKRIRDYASRRGIDKLTLKTGLEIAEES